MDAPRFPRSPAASLHRAVREALADAAIPVLPGHAAMAVFSRMDGWLPWLDDAVAMLHPHEAARARVLRRDDERNARVLAYALHRMLAASILGLPVRDVVIGRDALGCPRVEGLPLSTSLAHTGTVAAFAFCRHGPVGIDFERATSVSGIAELLSSVAHPVELGTVGDLSDPQARLALLDLWVRKEACLKAAGVGLRTSMTSFVAAPEAPVLLHLDGRPVPLSVSGLAMGPDWRAAIALSAPCEISSGWLRPAA